MNTRADTRDEGLIGLGVLVLMIVAFVSGQAQSHTSLTTEGASTPAPAVQGSFVPADHTQAIDNGAIRELAVAPFILQDAPELGWSSDAELIEKHRSSRF